MTSEKGREHINKYSINQCKRMECLPSYTGSYLNKENYHAFQQLAFINPFENTEFGTAQIVLLSPSVQSTLLYKISSQPCSLYFASESLFVSIFKVDCSFCRSFELLFCGHCPVLVPCCFQRKPFTLTQKSFKHKQYCKTVIWANLGKIDVIMIRRKY